MVKAPVAGRVKTRLGRDIGMTAAAWWYRHHLKRLIRRLSDPRWELMLAVTPDAQAGARFWPRRVARIGQGGGDLGRRMIRLLRDLPPGPALLIGSDIAGVGPAHIARAFRLLGGVEAVIGPARDGGFWLIGLNRRRQPVRDLLDGARWSTRYAQTDTLIALRDRRIAFADTLSDIDTAADLRRHYRVVKAGVSW